MVDSETVVSSGLVSYSQTIGGAAWRASHRSVEKVVDAINRQLESRLKLSFGDFMVLDSLAIAPPEGLRMTQLAEETLVSKSRLSHCIDRMETAGLVQRVRPEHDRRGFYAVMTENGRSLYRSAYPTVRDAIGRYFEGSLRPDELDSLKQFSTKIVEAVDSESAVEIVQHDGSLSSTSH